jgi:hypothetical protein
MKDRLKLIPAAEARRILLDAAGPLGVEEVPLHAAPGRVLASALQAPHDLPPHRLSAMDGYAARAADLAAATEASPARLRVVGNVPAGGTFDGEVRPGQAVGIATGGVVPAGADAVVMVELTANADPAAPALAYVPAGGELLVRKAVPAGGHVVQAGEDVKAAEIWRHWRALALSAYRCSAARASPSWRPARSCVQRPPPRVPVRYATRIRTCWRPRSSRRAASLCRVGWSPTTRTCCGTPSGVCWPTPTD